MTFSGTVADINAALDGLSYLPNAGYAGGDTLTISTKDSELTSVDIDANLQLLYRFDAGDPGNDGSPGGGNDGTVNGATPTVDGVRGDVAQTPGQQR